MGPRRQHGAQAGHATGTGTGGHPPVRWHRQDHRGRRWRRAAAIALATILMGTMSPVPAAATADPSPTSHPAVASAPAVPPGGYELTLITGDRVHLQQHPDGRLAVDVEPAERGGAPVDFQSIRSGEDMYVVPSDAAALVPDRLDSELFNVTGLVRAGYHADGTGTLPVIITAPDGRAAAPAVQPSLQQAGATPLRSIGGTAVALDPPAAEQFWRQVTASSGARTGTAALAGAGKVWLDRPHRIALDESVPLVGAPQAWAAGFDGTGVTVAVLDTGIDDTHPDLTGKVVQARNFTGEADTVDRNGHGTHVASIVAGTGAGAGGDRPGVAPGAQLVSAKVCNEFGTCPTSAIIAGMEWVAADLGVAVANMSIGTAIASDGTDLVSQAVNQLTAEYGTLFVVAAGNSGPRPTTIGSPGAADAALTVGSVTKSGFLAGSSSRGPRRGDFAVKPDITAPGVSIVAARAAGTSLGFPVDDLYTEASGTSMATPHVAGAAAILLQQDPDLDPPDLKAALAGTAAPNPNLTVYQQGGGLLDVASAVQAPVRATPAPLDLGYFPFPHDTVEPVTRTVTYRNLTGDELTLALSAEVTDESGDPPAPGMLTLERDRVTIPAGGTATVDVTVDAGTGDYGTYGGYLVARLDGTPVVRTPTGFVKEDERYDLAVRAIDTNGNPAIGGVTVINVDNQDIFFELSVDYDAAGEAHLRVPPGTYAVYGFADTQPPGAVRPTVRTAVAEPEIEVTGDVEVVFDARDAVPVTAVAPAHDTAPRNRTTLSLFRQPVLGAGAIHSVSAFVDARFQALPSDEATTGYFEFSSRWQLADPDDPVGTPVLYDVVFPEVGAIPPTLDYVARPEELGAVHNEFYNHLPDHPVQEVRHVWRPWQTSSLGIFEPVAAPARRTDYVSAADTASWTRSLWFAPLPGMSSAAARINAPRMEYQPGASETRTWMKQPVKPGMIEGSPWHPTFPQFREGDILDLFIAEFSGGQRGHWGFYSGSIDEASFRLYENGELIAEGVRPRGEFALSPEPSVVRVETDISRDQDWWRYSTRTSTAWEFETAHTPRFTAQVVAPEVIDLDLELLTGSPELAQVIEAPVVYAGLGHVEDFEGVDAEGAVVFMRRGELTFAAKAQHAADAGAVAAVIFNSIPGGFSGTVGEDGVIPTFSLSLEQGQAVVDLLDAGPVTARLTPGEPDVVPLLLVDYDVDLDLLNRARHPSQRSGPATVDLQVRHQPGFDGQPVPDRPAIDDARLWISYDDGQSWRERPGRDRGDGRFRFVLPSPDPAETNGFVALRVEAWDVAGNRIEQEIIRAWGLTPR